MTVFKNAMINGVITDISAEGGIIKEIQKTDSEGVDLNGLEVFPGLIDIHTHGAIGIDTMDGNIEDTALFYAKNGVTSFFPTTMTVAWDKIQAVVNRDIPKTNGAQILGYHLEGPYICEKYRGAQNKKYILNPDINEFCKLKNIKMVTIAPEKDGAMEFIEKCPCVVALGHSESDYDTAAAAFEHGAECVTHTFNAMPPLHHRNPSIVGAASDKNAYVQVICDGIHIHPAVIRILYKLFSSGRMILISDCMRATGLSDGEYEFGGQPILVKDSTARTLDGALAGSTSMLLKCVKKAIEFGIPKTEAFKMASETPARLMHLNKGILAPGYDCDFIAFDSDGKLQKTIIAGKEIDIS